MREVTAIEPKWLTEAAPTFYKVADANKISKRKRQEKIEVRHLRWLLDAFCKGCVYSTFFFSLNSRCIIAMSSLMTGDLADSREAEESVKRLDRVFVLMYFIFCQCFSNFRYLHQR
jgi:hypothetical protein